MSLVCALHWALFAFLVWVQEIWIVVGWRPCEVWLRTVVNGANVEWPVCRTLAQEKDTKNSLNTIKMSQIAYAENRKMFVNLLFTILVSCSHFEHSTSYLLLPWHHAYVQSRYYTHAYIYHYSNEYLSVMLWSSLGNGTRMWVGMLCHPWNWAQSSPNENPLLVITRFTQSLEGKQAFIWSSYRMEFCRTKPRPERTEQICWMLQTKSAELALKLTERDKKQLLTGVRTKFAAWTRKLFGS